MPKRSRSSSFKRTAKRTRKAPARSRMNSKLMLRMARSAVLRTCETKYISSGVENNQLFHNGGAGPTYVWFTNMLATAQGSQQFNRVGDEVWPKGLSVRLWLSNKLDRPNVMYRIMVISVPPDQLTATNPSGLFAGAIGNKMLDYVNTDRYTVKYSKLIQPFSGDYSLETGAANKEHSKMVKFYLPLKGKLAYTVDNGALPRYQKHILSLVVIAYDAYGSIATDNIASFSYLARFYFKDP